MQGNPEGRGKSPCRRDTRPESIVRSRPKPDTECIWLSAGLYCLLQGYEERRGIRSSMGGLSDESDHRILKGGRSDLINFNKGYRGNLSGGIERENLHGIIAG